jgi:hypothetical protein
MAEAKPDSRTSTQTDAASRQGNHGTFSDAAPGLVPPSRLNEGDTGAASDKPQAGGELNFDDGDMRDGGRGKNVRMGGTYAAQGADSAPLGPPAEIQSGSNQPSDPDNRPSRTRRNEGHTGPE